MPPWRPDVLEALSLHAACPQIDEDMSYILEHRLDPISTDEDCLYLNIFVPVLNNATVVPALNGNSTGSINDTRHGDMSTELLEVLVFIHGGSNVVGTANMFDGDILAGTGGIIVVTLNYRLAALGFLGTGDPDFPGNYGILDQIAALRWVQNNIAHFNGDPRKVTVLGHSAASMDVGVLLVSPLAKGLFRTAVSQSGAPSSILTNRWPAHNSTREVLDLGKHLNCTETTLLGVKECLKKIDVVTLLKSYEFYDWYQFPVVVGDKVLPKIASELLKTAELNAETFLIGTTRDEAGLWSYGLNGYANVSNLLILHHVVPDAIHFKDLVRFEYTDFTTPENSTTDVRIGSMVYGDSLFDAPTVETLDILSQRNISLYQYRWEWRSDLFPSPEETGVPHGSDLFYLFGSPVRGHTLYNYTVADRNMSYIMMRQWSHFVKFGTFEVNPEEWPVVPQSEDLMFERTLKPYTRFYSVNGLPAIGLGYNLKPRQSAFWNSVIPDLRDDINRTLTFWRAGNNTANNSSKTENNGKDGDTGINNRINNANLMKQKDLYVILFIIFLILSCVLLLLLVLICVMFCTSRNYAAYTTK